MAIDVGQDPTPLIHFERISISMSRLLVFVASCLLLIATVSQADAQWARFRGPNGSGVDLSSRVSRRVFAYQERGVEGVGALRAIVAGRGGHTAFRHCQRRRSVNHVLPGHADGPRIMAPGSPARADSKRIQSQRSGIANPSRRRARRRSFLS